MRVALVAGDIESQGFQDYLALKYQVFVQEHGWSLPSNRLDKHVLEDEYDKVSDQYIAYETNGRPVGTIRATRLGTVFPYKEYFDEHMGHGALDCKMDRCCCFTSMAVLRAYRGKEAYFRGVPVSIAKGLLWYVADDLRRKGVQLCLLTAVKGESAACFEHCGCYVLDGPSYNDKFGVEIYNMGLLLNDWPRFDELASPFRFSCNTNVMRKEESRLKSYLVKRHNLVMKNTENQGLFR
jgi:hypothetical protein